MFFGVMSFKAFTRIAFIATIVWLFNWLFSLDAKNVADLVSMTEYEVVALQEKLDFSDEVATVLNRAGANITLATLLVSCPGATIMVLTHEARKTKGRNFDTLPMEDDAACATVSFSEDVRVLWEGVSGGHLDWLIDAGLRTIVRWLKVAKKFSGTGQDPLGPETAASMVAGLLASSSRLYLRLTFALNRAFGVLSKMHGCMGELALVPPDVDFRALVASRDGSSVLAVVDMLGAHFSFWGDQIMSPATSSRDDKKIPQQQQQQQCHVVFKGSDEEKCRWWQPLCRPRLRLCRLTWVEARNAARETARDKKVKARAAKEAEREKKRREKERERQARKEKTLESMKNDPNSWIPTWG